MQNKLNVEILKIGYENIKSSLMSNLEAKGRYIQDARQKELTEASVRRINSEEKHIRLCIGTTDASDSLIEALQEVIQKQSEIMAGQEKKINFFYNETIEAQNTAMILQEILSDEKDSK